MFYQTLCVLAFALLPSYLSLGLQDCSINKTTKIKTVCKLIENYEIDYPPQPLPIIIDLNINILDIIDLDWTTNTITLFIQLWTFWKDPRITITNYIAEDAMKVDG